MAVRTQVAFGVLLAMTMLMAPALAETGTVDKICGTVSVTITADSQLDPPAIKQGLHETLSVLTGASMDSIDLEDATGSNPYDFAYCLLWQGERAGGGAADQVASVSDAIAKIEGDELLPVLQKRCGCCDPETAYLGVTITDADPTTDPPTATTPSADTCLSLAPAQCQSDNLIFKADAGDLACPSDWDDCTKVCCETLDDQLDPPPTPNDGSDDPPLEATCTAETMFCPLQRSLVGRPFYEMAGLTSLLDDNDPDTPLPQTPSPIQDAQCGIRSYSDGTTTDYYFYFVKRSCPVQRVFDYVNEEVIDVVRLRVPGEAQSGKSSSTFTSITFLGEETPQSLLNPMITCVCKSPISAIVSLDVLQATTLSPVDVEGTGVFDPTLCLYRKGTYEPQYLVGTGDRFPLLEPRYWLELKAPNPDDVIAFAHCAVSTSWLEGDNRLGLSPLDWDTTGLPSANPTTFTDANGQPAVLFLARSCPYSVVTDFVPEPVENFGGDSWFIPKEANGDIGFRGKSSAKLSIKNFRFYSYDTVFFTCKVLRCNTLELPESSNSCGRCESERNYEKGDTVRRLQAGGGGNAGATVDVWATTELQEAPASSSTATSEEVVSGVLELAVADATPFLQAGDAQNALRTALGKIAGVDSSRVSVAVSMKSRRRLQGSGIHLLVTFSVRVPSGSSAAAVLSRIQATDAQSMRTQIETELSTLGQTQGVVVIDVAASVGTQAPGLAANNRAAASPKEQTEQASSGRLGATVGQGLLALLVLAVTH